MNDANQDPMVDRGVPATCPIESHVPVSQEFGRRPAWRALLGALLGGAACLLVNVIAFALLPLFFAPGREDGHGGFAPILCSFYGGMPVMMLAGIWWAMLGKRQSSSASAPCAGDPAQTRRLGRAHAHQMLASDFESPRAGRIRWLQPPARGFQPRNLLRKPSFESFLHADDGLSPARSGPDVAGFPGY